MNDVWLSSNMGLSWSEQTGSAPWSARGGMTSVVISPNILIFGGYSGSGNLILLLYKCSIFNENTF